MSQEDSTDVTDYNENTNVESATDKLITMPKAQKRKATTPIENNSTEDGVSINLLNNLSNISKAY